MPKHINPPEAEVENGILALGNWNTKIHAHPISYSDSSAKWD
jgi:hypothetical protein